MKPVDENKKPNDQPEGEASEPELRHISPKQLKEILEAHRKWVESNGKEGDRADLANAKLYDISLQGANLSKANLEGAGLSRANFQGAHLKGANLEEARLFNANLQKADLTDANFNRAYLFKADLEGAGLSHAKFEEAELGQARLQETNMRGADLTGATLTGANLEGADLNKAILKDASLARAKLHEADLQDADLTGVTSLLGGQLAGTNVSGAKLPRAIQKFDEGLRVVEEQSRNARKLFFGMLAGCAYTVLTIATTTDARLLTNSASSPLPIIGTQIPIVGYYVVAPLVLLGLYLYFNLYMQRLWEGLSRLPAIFPDGRSLDQKAYPWLLIGYIRAHILRLRGDRPYLSRLQVFLSIVLTWWLVPATILLLWGRYLRRHDWTVTAIQIAILALSIGAGFIFQRLARKTLRGKEKIPFVWQRILKDIRTYKRAGVVLGSISVAALFYYISFGAINGVHPRFHRPGDKLIRFPLLKPANVRRWVPHAFKLIGYSPFSNLGEADVSVKPENWRGQKEQIPLVKGAFLKGRDLKFSTAIGAFLVNADLRDADLYGAMLAVANLNGANLQGADLSQAFLAFADLRGVNRKGVKIGGVYRPTNFQGANLWSADLSEAYLQWANFTEADLTGANLAGADLLHADLQWANLSDAKGLEKDQLRSARRWMLALYSEEIIDILGLPYDHNDRVRNKNLSHLDLRKVDLSLVSLKGANLQQADLQGANFLGSDLQEADLWRADLQEANLLGANLAWTNLQDAKNLTIRQLSEAKTLYEARLDPELMEGIRKNYPHLLGKPKWLK